MTVQIEVQYLPRPGYGFSKKDAEIIGPELTRLADTGQSSPKEIVEAARPDDAPLHRYFEWNDAVAAEAHRRFQARQMSRGIIVVVPTSKGAVEVPAFYSVATDEDEERAYLPVQSVLEDPDLVRRQLLRFQRDITRIRDEYAVFASVRDFNRVAGPVLNAIDKTLEEAA